MKQFDKFITKTNTLYGFVLCLLYLVINTSLPTTNQVYSSFDVSEINAYHQTTNYAHQQKAFTVIVDAIEEASSEKIEDAEESEFIVSHESSKIFVKNTPTFFLKSCWKNTNSLGLYILYCTLRIHIS